MFPTISACAGVHYSILDISGKLLISGTVPATQQKYVDLSNIKNGLFVIKISEQKKTTAQKFIIH